MIDRRTGWLMYDSSRESAAAGERNPLCSDRTLVFRSDALSVDLVVHASSGGLVYLHGQVVSGAPCKPVAGASVRLHAKSPPVHTDEHGQFCLSTLEPTGRDDLVIASGRSELVCRIPATDPAGAC